MPTATLLDVTDIVTTLAKQGVQIAIGRLDVLEQLPTLPVSQLRLPADVITRIPSNQRAAALVEGTIATAGRLGLQTTARGIDNETLATVLRDMGCAAGQGDHIATTMDADTAGRHLWAAEVTSEALHPPAELVVLARRRQQRRSTS
jgi:EAL domain-containing protein (putative c-di-GMP-specific phosphodiesterase class I)